MSPHDEGARQRTQSGRTNNILMVFVDITFMSYIFINYGTANLKSSVLMALHSSSILAKIIRRDTKIFMLHIFSQVLIFI